MADGSLAYIVDGGMVDGGTAVTLVTGDGDMVLTLMTDTDTALGNGVGLESMSTGASLVDNG